MTRSIILATLLCLTLSASAQQLPAGITSAREIAREAARWRRVEQLLPGQPIVLLERGSNRRFPCALDRVDDAVLTCIPFGFSGLTQRIVYPRTSVERVWAIEEVAGPSGGAMGFAAAIGAIFGGLIGAGAGVGGAFAGIFMGAAIAVGFVAENYHGYSERQVLLYKAH